mgnify:CR=1 FL=1
MQAGAGGTQQDSGLHLGVYHPPGGAVGGRRPFLESPGMLLEATGTSAATRGRSMCLLGPSSLPVGTFCLGFRGAFERPKRCDRETRPERKRARPRAPPLEETHI